MNISEELKNKHWERQAILRAQGQGLDLERYFEELTFYTYEPDRGALLSACRRLLGRKHA